MLQLSECTCFCRELCRGQGCQVFLGMSILAGMSSPGRIAKAGPGGGFVLRKKKNKQQVLLALYQKHKQLLQVVESERGDGFKFMVGLMKELTKRKIEIEEMKAKKDMWAKAIIATCTHGARVESGVHAGSCMLIVHADCKLGPQSIGSLQRFTLIRLIICLFQLGGQSKI